VHDVYVFSQEKYIDTENSEDIQVCFPPITLDSTGLPSEGRSFRSMFELKLV